MQFDIANDSEMNKSVAAKVFNALFESKKSQIFDWIDEKCKNAPPIPYNSMDIRNGGFKIAPVDVNFFPAGFNNLDSSSFPIASREFFAFFNRYFDGAKKILIIAEDHSRNLKYLESVFFLKKIIEDCNFQVEIANFINIEESNLAIDNNKSIKIQSLNVKNNRLIAGNGFDPDVIIINNDLTIRYPDFLDKIEQPIVPNLACGWFNRKKSTYFDIYQKLINDFGIEFSIDPWLFSPISVGVDNINFENDLELIAGHIEKIINQTKEKYLEYSIKWTEPYCFVKANNGTYGMGVIDVKSADEIFSLNKRARNDMKVVKQGVGIDSVIIQEGIPTIEKFNRASAEKTLYLVNGNLIGGFFRCNDGKDSKISLNSRSSYFEKIPFSDINTPILNFLARISYLAAAKEIEFLDEMCYKTS